MSNYILVKDKIENRDWIQQIHQLEHLIFDPLDAYSETNLNDMYENKTNYGFIVGLNNQVIIGYLIYLKLADCNEIMKIAVKSEYRRMKLGTLLLDELKKANKTILLEVAANNEGAISFYLRNGFSKDSYRKKYYANNIDALLLSWKPN